MGESFAPNCKIPLKSFKKNYRHQITTYSNRICYPKTAKFSQWLRDFVTIPTL